MAKAKKSKNEEQKGDNSEAMVRHQKLCLSIDMENQRVYGFTELEVVVPENGIVGFHADNLAIDSVTVDGEPAKFEVFPHFSHLDSEDRWCSVSTATSAADAAGSSYILALERELVPNLLIMCSQTSNSEGEQLDVLPENGEQPNMETKQNVKMIRIDYWVEKAETGIHLNGNVLHTDNQIRRARCWFPCMDNNMQSCCYDLEFTVARNYVAVSTGTLLYQVWTKDDPPRKTYVYKLNVPVAAQWISLVVAPLEILPDRHNGILSHMCLPGDLSKLRNTVSFFHGAFSYYEDYLSAKFPFGSYTQVFIAPEMAISSLSLGASMSIFSSHVLFDEKVIDQTIESRIKLAHALARQWFGVYITSEAPSDEWLLDGLDGFLTDLYIKRFLGNNEARFRRYKANCAVCRIDDSCATSLRSSSSSKDLYGTECVGFYGKIRSWKSVAILQMLEKQMGPEPFRKILQIIVSRAQDATHPSRNLSTKEFRHLANKVGNLERPFLKEFFPRWVGSCGCPVLKMGFSYNKRKNLVELAVLRGCTSRPDSRVTVSGRSNESESREGDDGWPGMMSIRVHELDGMYDHPILPMAGEPWQILEIQCHSKLASKRFQKPKKGSRPDGSDDNGDSVPAPEMRSNSDAPLLWLRADPEMEYLAEIRFIQPVQMWINQLERDKDVVAQVQAISTLETLPQVSSAIINALSSSLSDSKIFWRVRIEAAFALAKTTSEETDFAGLFQLINFYKSRRYDPNIGLPKPNDFHDFQEYFVLEAIPHAIATVRTADEKSHHEAVEFILQILKALPRPPIQFEVSLRRFHAIYHLVDQINSNSATTGNLKESTVSELNTFPNINVVGFFYDCFQIMKPQPFILNDRYNDNNGNPYSDVFWLAALVQSVGELEFSQQSAVYLSSLLKHLDRLLQFDRLMPSHNGVLTVSCIQTLVQIALKLSEFLPLDRVTELIKPFRVAETSWQIRIEACRALLDLEFQCKGIGSALMLFITYLDEETSVRGQVKLGIHALRLCQIRGKSDSVNDIKSETLLALLRLLESPMSFNNVILRHYIFSMLQVLAGRAPTLHGVPRDETLRMGHTETYTIFAALVKQSKSPELPLSPTEHEPSAFPPAPGQADSITESHERTQDITDLVPETRPASDVREATREQINTEGEPLREELVPQSVGDVLTTEDTEQKESLTNLSLDGAICGPPKSFDEVLTTENNEQKNALISHLQDHALGSEPPREAGNLIEAPKEVDGMTVPNVSLLIGTIEKDKPMEPQINDSQANPVISEAIVEADFRCDKPDGQENLFSNVLHENSSVAAASREQDTVSNSQDRKKPIFRIKVKQSAASSRAGGPDFAVVNKSQDGHRDADRGGSSSMSVDAPQRNITDCASISNQNVEDVNSCHDVGSRVTASIGSVKVAAEADEIGKELQCTADSSKVTLLVQLPDQATSGIRESDAEACVLKYATAQSSFSGHEVDRGSLAANKPQGERKDKKKDKKRKRDEHKAKHNDPEYIEKKRLKKEKKRKEKELSKILQEAVKVPSAPDKLERTNNLDTILATSRTVVSIQELENKQSDVQRALLEVPEGEPKSPYSNNEDDSGTKTSSLQMIPGGTSGVNLVEKRVETNVSQSKPSNKVRIKIKKMM